MHNIEIEYFKGNIIRSQELMNYYYEQKEYFLLYYVARDLIDSNNINSTCFSYLLVSLYEIGELKILNRLITSKVIDLYLLLMDKSVPEVLHNHVLEVLIKLLYNREENNNLRNIPMYKHGISTEQYDVISYSDKIGCNMTVIRTYYGLIIIDCGASQENNRTITEKEFEDFFNNNSIKKEDIIAVFITHAHYDHYGSIQNFVKWGVSWTKVFANDITRELISLSNKEISIANAYEFNDFRNSNIKITPFYNGHILGSVGLLITIDKKTNILFSGDFCFHNQSCVDGLKVAEIEELKQGSEIDCLIIETTYGEKLFDVSYETNKAILKKVVEILNRANIKMFFPAFAIGRSQEILEIIKESFSTSIRIDGLSCKITEYIDNLNYRPKILSRGVNSLANNSDKINNMLINAAIIASSGMITPGSVSNEYINEFLNNEITFDIRIIKTGFIIPNTEGDKILKKWEIEKNNIIDITLSAHASYDELIQLISITNPKKILQIHGNGIIF